MPCLCGGVLYIPRMLCVSAQKERNFSQYMSVKMEQLFKLHSVYMTKLEVSYLFTEFISDEYIPLIRGACYDLYNYSEKSADFYPVNCVFDYITLYSNVIYIYIYIMLTMGEC